MNKNLKQISLLQAFNLQRKRQTGAEPPHETTESCVETANTSSSVSVIDENSNTTDSITFTLGSYEEIVDISKSKDDEPVRPGPNSPWHNYNATQRQSPHAVDSLNLFFYKISLF